MKINLNRIKLVDAIPELKKEYRRSVKSFIKADLITLKEWNTRFKDYRDEIGYSMIHYLEAVMNNISNFCTVNPIMIANKTELVERFKVNIIIPNDFVRDFIVQEKDK